jgi:hypothetical protein
MTVLDGVPPLTWGGIDNYTDDLMVSSTLRVCLDHIGEERSKPYLAGTCGAAFETGWAAGTLHSGGGGAVLAHPNHFEQGLANLFGAVGRSFQVVHKSDPERLWQAAADSLEAGRPVLASEWRIDHFAVLAGCDPAERVFLGRRYQARTEVQEEYDRIKPEELAFVVAIGEPTEPVPAEETVRGALRFAVRSARTGRDTEARGQGGTSHAMIYGPEAFEEHGRMVPEQLDPAGGSYPLREHFLYWRLDALQLARAYAVLYLRQAIEKVPAPATEALREAEAAYCEVLGMLTSDNAPPERVGGVVPQDPRVAISYDVDKTVVNPLFWVEGGRPVHVGRFLADAGGRRRFADWLRQVGGVEQRAVAALAAALTQSPGAV